VTATVGAGVAGDGEVFWTHPAKRIQSMSVRKIRGRNAFFMARDLFHPLITFRPAFPGTHRWAGLSLSLSASGRPGARSGDVISPGTYLRKRAHPGSLSGTTSITPVVDIAMLAEFILIIPFTANRLYRSLNE